MHFRVRQLYARLPYEILRFVPSPYSFLLPWVFSLFCIFFLLTSQLPVPEPYSPYPRGHHQKPFPSHIPSTSSHRQVAQQALHSVSVSIRSSQSLPSPPLQKKTQTYPSPDSPASLYPQRAPPPTSQYSPSYDTGARCRSLGRVSGSWVARSRS